MIINYFIGIDPGQTGGVGIIDSAGKFVAAHRWNLKNPIYIYDNILLRMKGLRVKAYLEDINIPITGAGIDNRFSASSNLWVNFGIWQGWLMAAGLAYDLISPATWQAAAGLFQWKKKIMEASFGGPRIDSPLTLARRLWPSAPLEFQADDGKAVGLHLAALALQDHHNGIDRGEVRARAQEKAKRKKKEKKALRELTEAI
jgi:hypothetical protein